MESQVQAAMDAIDREYAARMAVSERDMLTRHSRETVDALLEYAARLWRTERQTIETRVRNAVQELQA